MKFNLTVQMDNDAFAEDSSQELSRILRVVADSVEDYICSGPIKDANGAAVGSFNTFSG